MFEAMIEGLVHLCISEGGEGKKRYNQQENKQRQSIATHSKINQLNLEFIT